jgi:hypothetical protein
MSKTHFMKIQPAILQLLHAYKWTSSNMTYIKDYDITTHAQKCHDDVTELTYRLMGNDTLIVQPHDFENPSCWY